LRESGKCSKRKRSLNGSRKKRRTKGVGGVAKYMGQLWEGEKTRKKSLAREVSEQGVCGKKRKKKVLSIPSEKKGGGERLKKLLQKEGLKKTGGKGTIVGGAQRGVWGKKSVNTGSGKVRTS